MIQPNTPQESIRLLWLDRNDTISFLFTVDGQPVDVRNRTFELCFYNASDPIATTPVLTIADTRLEEVTGRNEKRSYLPTDADRTALPVEGDFIAVLFETTGNVRDYYAFFKFGWLKTPPEITDLAASLTNPRQVPAIQLDQRSAASNVVVIPVYEVPNVLRPFASVALALAAPDLGSEVLVSVVDVNGKRAFIKDSIGLREIVLNDYITA